MSRLSTSPARTVCDCGCGRARSQRRLGPSNYEVFLGNRSIGTVRQETVEVELTRPGRYVKDKHWVNSVDREWSPTRAEAIGILLLHAHEREGAGG